MRIGLSFDEFVELRWRSTTEGMGFVKCVPGQPPVFEPMPEDDEPPESQLFPMSTAQAASHLRSRGYDCRPAMLDLLVENGVVRPSQPDGWTKADVDRAAEHFEEASLFTPYAAMCLTLGCSYAAFLRPLRDAAREASRKYKRRIPPDDQLFVLHRIPPRGDQSAVITFTLADDVRERLERGEEV